MGAGSSFMMDEISDACVAPENAFLPVAISYSTHPNEKMSVRPSASRPSSCSGAMYWNVPRIVPSCVRLFGMLPSAVGSDVTADCTGGAIAFANPKSSSFTPDFVIITLPGFRSRCTIPCRCALSSASVICVPYRSVCSSGSAPLRETIAQSVSPSSSSITRYSTPSALPTSYSAQMFECESCEIVLASRSNRCRISGDADRCCGSTFTATVRSSRVSFAL